MGSGICVGGWVRFHTRLSSTSSSIFLHFGRAALLQMMTEGWFCAYRMAANHCSRINWLSSAGSSGRPGKRRSRAITATRGEYFSRAARYYFLSRHDELSRVEYMRKHGSLFMGLLRSTSNPAQRDGGREGNNGGGSASLVWGCGVPDSTECGGQTCERYSRNPRQGNGQAKIAHPEHIADAGGHRERTGIAEVRSGG